MMTLKRKLFGTNLGWRSLLAFYSGQILHFLCQKYFFFIWRTILFSKVHKNSLMGQNIVGILKIVKKNMYIKRTHKLRIKIECTISVAILSGYMYVLNIVDKFCGSKLANPLWPTLLFKSSLWKSRAYISTKLRDCFFENVEAVSQWFFFLKLQSLPKSNTKSHRL